MEDRKIRMFAEFLNCDFEFLNCTQAVERRSETPEDYNPKRYEDLLEDLERIERFTHFLLDYNVEIIPTKYAKDTTTIKVLEGRNVYEYEIDINRKAISYEIYCPEHDSVQVSRSQLDKFTDDLIKHAKWLIYEIKIDNLSNWTVEYTVPSTGSDYYYIYTVNNVSDDHVILVEENGPFIPPEEDETKTYWPVTISSINATTNPMNGTTRVVEGSNQIITITPTDPQLTLALDNGVDITSQLQGGVPNNTYTIDTQVSGADYGFSLNNSTGYYISSNDGVSKSASVARLNMNFESDCLVTIQYINYAEEDYDYGMFGKLDVEVATDGLTAGQSGSSPSDSTSNYQIARCTNSTSTQTVTYEVPFGEHFIDIKYGKDDASDSGNDNLQ
jgi:hypothetical protein